MKLLGRRLLVLAIAIWLAPFLLVAGSSRSASALQAGSDQVAGVKGCIGPAFDGDAISIQSRCTETVAATWFFGSGHQGFASLAPGQSVPTGVSAGQIPELGALRFFACPATHPVFLAANGAFMSDPAVDYLCGVPHSSFSGTGPRAFHYDVLTSGDCVLEKGALTFKASGQGMWEARIHTNHTTNRDLWHISFAVLDASGRRLFVTNPGDSPAMYGSPSPVIPWGTPFTFEATQFGSIQNVQVSMSC